MRRFEFMDKYGARMYPRIQDVIPVVGDLLTDNERVGCDINVSQVVGGDLYIYLENSSDEMFTRACFEQDTMLDSGIADERQYGHFEFRKNENLSDSDNLCHFEMFVRCFAQNRMYLRRVFE